MEKSNPQRYTAREPERRFEVGRVMAATCALPVVAFVLATIMYPALYPSDVQFVSAGLPTEVRVGLAAAIAAVPISVIGVLVLLLWRTLSGRTGWIDAAVIGMILGNIPLLYFTMIARAEGASRTVMKWSDVWTRGMSPVVMGSCLGLVCASVFWAIARRALSPHD